MTKAQDSMKSRRAGPLSPREAQVDLAERKRREAQHAERLQELSSHDVTP